MAEDPLSPPDRLREDWRILRHYIRVSYAFGRSVFSMRIWREVFTKETLFSWNFIGWAVALLAGAGPAMLGLTSITKGLSYFTAAEICFVLAAFVMLAKIAQIAVTTNYPFWERAIFTGVFFAVVGIFLVETLVWIQRNRPQSQTQTQAATSEFSEQSDKVHFSLGERGIMYTWKLSEMETGKKAIRNLDPSQPDLAVAYAEDGKLYFDTQLLWSPESPPVQIRHNQIIDKPYGWDLNSNMNAFEIVNEHGNAVFQIIYRSQFHIVMNAVFYIAGHKEVFIADDDGVQGVPLPKPGHEYSLKRIFKYPSWKFPGEYQDHETVTPHTPERKSSLEQELDITFDETQPEFVDPTKVTDERGVTWPCKLYRVAVTNHSSSPVTRLLAKGVRNFTEGRTYTPLHLRITGKSPTEKEIRLHKGESQFWDVIEKKDSDRGWARLMETDLPRGHLVEIPSDFIITASCDDGLNVTRRIVLRLKDNDDLDFRLADP